MSDELVQISQVRVEANRLPRGQRPVFETRLGAHQRCIGVAFSYEHDYANRQTVDHVAVLWVESRLGPSLREGSG